MTSRSEHYPLLYFLLDEQAASVFSQHAVNEGRGLAFLLLQELSFLRLPCSGGRQLPRGFAERIFLTYVDNNSNNTVVPTNALDRVSSSENEIRYLLKEEEVNNLHSLVRSRIPLHCIFGKLYDRVFQSIAIRLAKKLPAHSHSLSFLRHMVIDPSSSSFDYGSTGTSSSSSAASKLELITIMGGPHCSYFYGYLQSRDVAADLAGYKCWVEIRSTLLKLDKLRFAGSAPLIIEMSNGAAESVVDESSSGDASVDPLDTFKLLLLDLRQLKAKVFDSKERQGPASSRAAVCSGVTDSLRLEMNALIAATSSVRPADIESVERSFALATGSKIERVLRVLERCVFEHFLEHIKPLFLQSREYLLLLAHMHSDRSADVQDFLAFSNFLFAIRNERKLLRLRESGSGGLTEQLLLLASEKYGRSHGGSVSIAGGGASDAEPSWPRVATFVSGKIFLCFEEQQPELLVAKACAEAGAAATRPPSATSSSSSSAAGGGKAAGPFLKVVKRHTRRAPPAPTPQAAATRPPLPASQQPSSSKTSRASKTLSGALRTVVGGLSLAIPPLPRKAAQEVKTTPSKLTPRGSNSNRGAQQALLSNSSPVLSGSSISASQHGHAAPHIIAMHASIDHFKNITAENICSLSCVWVRRLSIGDSAPVGSSRAASALGRQALQQLLLLNGLFDHDILSYDSSGGGSSGSGKSTARSSFDNITKALLLPRDGSTEKIFDYYHSHGSPSVSSAAGSGTEGRASGLLVHVSSQRTSGGLLCLGIAMAPTSPLVGLGRRVSALCCSLPSEPSPSPAPSADHIESALQQLCDTYREWSGQVPPSVETIYDLYGAPPPLIISSLYQSPPRGMSRMSVLQGPCDYSLLHCVLATSPRLLAFVCMLTAAGHRVLLISRSTSLLVEALLAVTRLTYPLRLDSSLLLSMNSLEAAELWWSDLVNTSLTETEGARRGRLAGMQSGVFALCSISTWLQQHASLSTPSNASARRPSSADTRATSSSSCSPGGAAIVVVDIDSCQVLYSSEAACGGTCASLASASSSSVAAMSSPAMGRLCANISSLQQELVMHDFGSSKNGGVLSGDCAANSAVEGAFARYVTEVLLRLLPQHTLHYREHGVIVVDAEGVLHEAAAAAGDAVEALFLSEVMESSCFLDLLARQGRLIAAL